MGHAPRRADPRRGRDGSIACATRCAPATTVQELLGHRDVTPIVIYTYVLSRGPAAVGSPPDRVLER